MTSKQKFSHGDKVRKVGGTYQADGVIAGVALTRSGEVRYVFEFDQPAGMLHIFNEGQLEHALPAAGNIQGATQ